MTSVGSEGSGPCLLWNAPVGGAGAAAVERGRSQVVVERIGGEEAVEQSSGIAAMERRWSGSGATVKRWWSDDGSERR